MPASDVRDNEFVPGHLTGYNFLALSGLKLAIEMADETGHADLAQEMAAPNTTTITPRSSRCSTRRPPRTTATFRPRSMARRAATTGATCSPSSPSRRSSRTIPRVTATLKATQAKYAEGIMTYADGEFLHHYLTIKNTMTEVIRGDQEQAVNELYALLLHTSSTQAGFEFAILPWGDRNFGDNLAPHGWFAAEYRTLLRNMLVREQGDELHLLSVVSPEWIGDGKTIAVKQAPTYFGTVAFTLTQPSAQRSPAQARYAIHSRAIGNRRSRSLVRSSSKRQRRRQAGAGSRRRSDSPRRRKAGPLALDHETHSSRA